MKGTRWRGTVLVVWLFGWAIVHAAVGWHGGPPAGPRSFNSPDETANYFFARRVAQDLPLAAPALADDKSGVVHPRSMLVYAGRLVPASFIGLPVWYGMAARVGGVGVLPYLTPFLAALGGYALYRLALAFFSPAVAWWSAISLPLLPPWWYYSGRGLFPNVPFVTLALIGGWASIAALRTGRRVGAFVAGAALGAAVAIRPVEAIWVVPLLVVAAWCERRRLRRVGWVFVLGLAAGVAPVLLQQQATFGHPFASGYLLPSADGGASVAATSALLPFGLHPRRALLNFWRFMFGLQSVVAWPAALGLLLQVQRWRRQSVAARWAMVALVGTAVWLVPYYGSAALFDNLDPNAVTLAGSYVRYWLPLSVMMLPYAVSGLLWTMGRLRGPWLRRVVLLSVFAGFSVWSIRLTLDEPLDGLGAVTNAVRAGYVKREAVVRYVPSDAVVVAERADKLFFPQLPVIATLRDPQVQRALPALLEHRPVYWYTFMDDEAIAAVRGQLLPLGLTLDAPVSIAAAPTPERLFRVRRGAE
ncbi:MAG: glycosyltransferase family 39 protein [bacterium]|nr:glycosyltransferase family 39 protein [bacterium]